MFLAGGTAAVVLDGALGLLLPAYGWIAIIIGHALVLVGFLGAAHYLRKTERTLSNSVAPYKDSHC